MRETWTIKGWITGTRGVEFPEAQTALVTRTAPVGVCISGGGTRSMVAGMGQLRGLRALGVLDQIRYLSCVSGGSWLCTAFTFYAEGAADDDAFLGPVTDPADLTMAGLSAAVPRDCVGWTATQRIGPVLSAVQADGAPLDRVWVEAIGRVFLTPWGLHAPDAPCGFTQDAELLADIGARNPALDVSAFHRVRDPQRPFLIVNTVVVGVPALERLDLITPAPMEVTPVYGGSPFGREVLFSARDRSWRSHWLGGGMMESWGLGCADGAREVGPNTYAFDAPPRPYTLADATGTSSAFYAGLTETMPGGFATRNPTLRLWPVRDGASASVFSMGDGGVLDNYGLLALLRRKLPRVVVFVNTSRPLNLAYDARTQTPQAADLDYFLPALFGFSVPQPGVNTAGNHVFRSRDFVTLVEALQAAKRAGGPVVAKTTLELLPNAWWQIEGGWHVEIVWHYLDTATRFEGAIADPAVHAELDKRARAIKPMQGRLAGFPNYSTCFASGTDLLQLNPEQVKLLADQTCWSVMESRALIEPWFAD